jgi:glycosyltransferase involved in cell wall biosynthesis
LSRKDSGGPSVHHVMPQSRFPSISVVMPAYQAERWIGAALDSVFAQTLPADEVIVVDDGSTDGTARELERFAGRIRVIRQRNAGCPAAYNRGFAEATGDFIARCDADDLWDPHKLEWQAEAIRAHREVDVLFGRTVLFGTVDAAHPAPPQTGLLESASLRRALFGECVICAPSVMIRRSLFERLGPYIEDFGAEDYEYWMRCLRAGARFYYDPRLLLRYRRHDANITNGQFWVRQCQHEVRCMYAADLADRALVDQMLAADLFKIGRGLVDRGRPREARQAFARSLRHARGAGLSANARALAWILLLAMPAGVRESSGKAVVGLSRGIDQLRGGRHPALP